MLGLGGILDAPPGALLGATIPDSVLLALFAVLMGLIALRMGRGPAAVREVPLGRFVCERDPAGEGVGDPSSQSDLSRQAC